MVERLNRRVTLDDAMPVRRPWTPSPDGIVWTRVPDNETVHGSMTGETARGSGLVAVRADARGARALAGTFVFEVQKLALICIVNSR